MLICRFNGIYRRNILLPMGLITELIFSHCSSFQSGPLMSMSTLIPSPWTSGKPQRWANTSRTRTWNVSRSQPLFRRFLSPCWVTTILPPVRSLMRSCRAANSDGIVAVGRLAEHSPHLLHLCHDLGRAPGASPGSWRPPRSRPTASACRPARTATSPSVPGSHSGPVRSPPGLQDEVDLTGQPLDFPLEGSRPEQDRAG